MSYDNWSKFKIEDLCDVSSSKRIYRKEYVDKGVPFYRSKEIILKHNNQEVTDTLYISNERFYELNSKFGSPTEGDILLTSVGTLGVPYRVKSGEKFYFKDGNLTWFKNLNNKVDSEFLYYWLFSSLGQKAIDDISIGSTQRAITIKGINTIEIRLPSINQQKALANILSSLDKKIELNNKIDKNLEEMSQALYKQWFVDFEFPNEDGEPYKSSGGEMIESELGLIPKGWEVKELKSICKNDVAICGKTPSTKKKEYYGDDVPFIKIPDMHNVIYVVDSNTKLSKEGQKTQSNKTLPKGSVCISCIGSPGLTVITIEDSQTNQQINSVIPKTEDLLYYTYLNLESRAEEIKALGSAGTTLYNLNKTSFEKIKIIVPNNVVLSHFHKIIEPSFQTILNGYLQNKELSNTRDTLLPKLMSGEIEVPVKG
jgi:type I restriction enzyme S subunit